MMTYAYIQTTDMDEFIESLNAKALLGWELIQFFKEPSRMKVYAIIGKRGIG